MLWVAVVAAAPGDAADLAAQVLVEFMPLDDARRGAAIGERMRLDAGELVDRAHAVLPVHLDDPLGRASPPASASGRNAR